MDWMISLAQLLLSLSFLVAVHEFGHLIAAKYFGMRVEQFSIGFPPKIWSFKKGETEYAISAIPLGGYVKISGMIDESLDTETMKLPPQPWEFRSKPAWQRLIVMLGGITVNVIVGVMIFIGLTFTFGDTYWLNDEINKRGGILAGPVAEDIGLQTGDKIVQINGKDFKYFQDIIRPETLLSNNAYYTVERDGKLVDIAIPADFIQKFNKKETASNFIFYRFPPLVGRVQKGSVADKAGVRVDDVVVEIDGKPITYHDEVTPTLKAFSGDTLSFSVIRNGERISFREYYKGSKALGFSAKEADDYMKNAEVSIKYGFLESIPLGTERAFTTLKTQVTAFGKVISGVLSPKESLSGPIGIMQAFGEEWDWERFWQLTGVLSLVLAFMNLLPIPALDGGHVMFLTYEIVSRRKPSDKFLETAQKVGMVFLLALMVFIFANDIIKIFSPN
jgi:regulator of sigma E protease